MKMGYTFSTKEKLILEATLKVMHKNNFLSANISETAKHTMLKPEAIKAIYNSDDALRMAAIFYAASIWVDYIKKDIAGEKDKKTRLRRLLRHYAAGSESYPASLSLYIDIWKIIRDGQRENEAFFKEELQSIYTMFVEAFEELILQEICQSFTLTSEIRQLAWIIVVISDGLHIQNLIEPESIDFDGVEEVLYKMVESYLLETGKEV
ncbi:hypothetical protein [Alkaliphilus peptidifermentans]|uniref:Transcriptional regulator, TetR family n=1 Tax=Alkaliphilus peptidifermentans DSM 18978 TaxID=1120976 RepID=A0A1G5I449_9FIRM|nr:hypothetical protein [Alkaliphilus peptidifermentans]SCY70787.1 hypothetical protein SAMN03080606_02247 [Alkaliphilus peptidifermentans DSM 18978]